MLIITKSKTTTLAHLEYVHNIVKEAFERFPDAEDMELLVQFDGADNGFRVNLKVSADVSFGFQGLDEKDVLCPDSTIDLFKHEYETGCRCHLLNPMISNTGRSVVFKSEQ